METKVKNKTKGISLIVLVITILVLAILAATVIISLSNTNVITEASDAVNKTEAQQLEEAKTLMYSDGMLGYNPEDKVIGNTTLSWNDTNKSITVTVDTVKIPDGFYYVGGTKDTGLVISDNSADAYKGVDYTCVGNQFVWVPVEYTATGTTDTNGLDTGFTAVFKRGSAEKNSDGIYKMTGDIENLEDDYTEPYADGYATETAEYYAMCKSVQKYSGFYIARFEAGDGDATYGTNSVIQGKREGGVTQAHTVISKKNAYVYNYVHWGETMSNIDPFTSDDVDNVAGAVYLSQNMYKNHKSVVSTLCYGVQWDATMNFVSDAEHVIVESWLSRYWGNFDDSRGAASENCGYDNMNFTTGRNEAWKAKNIYDLAGNVMEWTMESHSYEGRGELREYRVARGGCFSTYVYGGNDAASDRKMFEPYISIYSYRAIGFRPTLYIKV